MLRVLIGWAVGLSWVAVAQGTEVTAERSLSGQVVAPAEAARALAPLVADTSRKGSLLIFPKVELRWNLSGYMVQDTFLNLSNAYPDDVCVQLYFVNGDPPLPEIPPDRAHSGWNWIDNWITLTANEPTYWSVLSGNPKGLVPFEWLDPTGNPLLRGRPANDGTGERVLRGAVLAWAINYDGEEICWNHLMGGATIINYQHGTAWEYNAYAVPVAGDYALGAPTGTPGQLLLDGVEYEYCPDRLLFDFFAVGSTALSGELSPVVVDSDLTLLPLQLDLRQSGAGPITTLADFEIWNMNEVKFSNTQRCITFWEQQLLSFYGTPNHFLLQNLQTDAGKARVDGVEDLACNDSVYAPLIGVLAKLLSFNGGADLGMDGVSLAGTGTETATILVDIPDPPEVALQVDSDSYGRSTPAPKLPGQSSAPATPEPEFSSRADDDRVSVNRDGSLLIYPKVELRWDEAGNLIQDTFLSIRNDYPAFVDVRLYFFNGDPPIEESAYPERAHLGWNWLDPQITLTTNEAAYWSVATGAPKGLPPFTLLDPSVDPLRQGRPADDGSSDRVLRGYVLAWAINEHGQEIRWNYLGGGATIVNYADSDSWAYSACAFRALDQGGTVNHGDQTGTPLILNLDGSEYDYCFDDLLLDFYSIGSYALSGLVEYQADTDLTLLPVLMELRPTAGDPALTKANFGIWNMNEVRFSGTARCVQGWDQQLLSNYALPNHFRLDYLQTDAGRAEIDGIASVVCGPESINAPLVGVAAKLLDSAVNRTYSGRALPGKGTEVGEIRYGVDCNDNGIPDDYDLASGAGDDCQPNGVLDECDIAEGTSDDVNGNGIPDECEDFCPDGIRFIPSPPTGAVDARKPYPSDVAAPLYGFGMPDDPATAADESGMTPIVIDLGVIGAGDWQCWELCEVPPGGNYVDTVMDHSDGTYTITLAHGIAATAVTTIQYDGGPYVEYLHHPGNIDGSAFANANDITVEVDCLNHPGTCNLWQEDVDFSGTATTNDIIETVNLLNGAGAYTPGWFGTPLPANDGSCP